MKRIKKYWWIILICVMVIYLIFVGVMNIPNINRATKDILDYINLLITPLGIILGIILGYPLLKKKLIEVYISKEFEIMHNANLSVRNKCKELIDKYQIKENQQKLTSEYLDKTVEDFKRVYEMSIDANPYAYRYSLLVYHSLIKFQERTKDGIPVGSYCENLSSLINLHLNQIYDYSKSIGVIFNNNITKKNILVKRIDKYITNNTLYEIPSVKVLNTSALLILFYYINNRMLSDDNVLLLQCCYETAPTPSPFARLMYNEKIYIPLKIDGGVLMNFFKMELVLVGYKRYRNTKIESGIVTYFYKCIYTNITKGVFVSGTIKNKDDFAQYKDNYVVKYNDYFNLAKDVNSKDFQVKGEQIIIEIDEQKVKEYFNKIKKNLHKKMKEEFKNS